MEQQQHEAGAQTGVPCQAQEKRLALVHRVLIPDTYYPKEYAILVTDQRSIFIRQAKTRSSFWLRSEIRWGTALVTDVTPKTLQDYEKTNLENLSSEPSNFTISHQSMVSLVVKGDRPTFRHHEFFVKWTVQRRKEIFQVYNFETTYRNASNVMDRIKFYAVPLGAYFKPKRQSQTRETILREYAEEIVETYKAILPADSIFLQFNDQPAAIRGSILSASRAHFMGRC